jgi:hypothetical protein
MTLMRYCYRIAVIYNVVGSSIAIFIHVLFIGLLWNIFKFKFSSSIYIIVSSFSVM